MPVRLLRRDGYKILMTTRAQDAFELLAKHDVQVILSDQRMPEMSGTEFFSRVKDLHPDTMRIVLSGYTDLKSVTDAINQGAIYRFLTKPWDDEQLRQITAQVPGVVYRVVLMANGERQLDFISDGVRELYGVAPEDAVKNRRNTQAIETAPKASMMSRNSSMSPGVRWHPASTFTFCGARRDGISSGTKVSMVAIPMLSSASSLASSPAQ